MLRLLAIVGSARFTSPDAEPRARHIIRTALLEILPDVVISGGAPCVDTWAEEEAVELGWFEHAGTLRIHRPRVKRWKGPGGFQERNGWIAADCTDLLRIACANATTYGSGWTADRAESLGKSVRRHIIA